MKCRRQVVEDLNSLILLKERHGHFEEYFVQLLSEKTYNKILQHYNDLIKKITKQIEGMPIGHRYQGTFYLKKPYTVPSEFEKNVGSIFMREDLVSWKIEKDPEDYTYYRTIYKTPDEDKPITREDGKPVFADLKD